MSLSVPRSFRASLVLTLVAAALSVPALGQASRSGSTPPPGPSSFDLFGGYGYLRPVDSDINNYKYQPVNPGAVVSVTGYFNQYLGVQAEGSFFPQTSNDCILTAQAGPVLRFERRRLAPFAHALGGGARVGGPVLQPCKWGFGVTAGIGLDYIVPAFNNHLAIRPIQADYAWSLVDYGPLVLPAGRDGGTGEIIGYRLSGGLVLRLGEQNPPLPVQLGCSIEPGNLYPGDPITVTASTLNLNPHRKPIYTWASTGGQLTVSDATATINTTGLAAGDYTVTGKVSEGGRLPRLATCTGGFRVREFEPPTISCSANPSTLMPGDPSVITSQGRSPQNRPLTYSYSSTGGQITGSTPTANLTTANAQPGAITVTCNVVDDLGKQATTTTSVTVNAPPTPPAPQPRNLCSLSFDRDLKRPVRVDNEAKGCLDEIALTLNRESGARLVIVGKFAPSEKPEAAEERTLNVQQYLTDEKGVDPSRIELRKGDASGRVVENTLVPSGVNFDPGSTTTFDTGTVKRHGQAYGKPRATQVHKTKQ